MFVKVITLKLVQMLFTCVLDCPILIPPSNGVINTTIESQGIVVGVTCNSGYTLFGNNVMLCQTNANWDTEVPLCKKGISGQLY